MEAPEEVTTHIAKGKRTKRQRVQSPIPFAPTTNSSSGGGGGGGGGGGTLVGDVDDDDDDDEFKNNNGSWSPPTSSNNIGTQADSTEDEDMANCLILLAQGVCRESPKPEAAAAAVEDNDTTTGVYYNNHANAVGNTHKFSSRKFLEAATGSGKAGYYVYECKTCNRTFPSFQALGGHRASHKKPKTTFDERKHHPTLSSDEEDGNYKNISSLSLQLSNHHNSSRGNHISNNNKAKVHECSICGAEFTSGQALGGHMRRHRAPMGNSGNTALSLTPLAIEYHEEEPKKGRDVISLDLDLNLPAPSSDDEKFSSFASKQQQQQKQDKTAPLVFSSPALVDCHY